MDGGGPSSVVSPQCRSMLHAGSVLGRWAEWASERVRKRIPGLTRFEEEGLGEKERACLYVDMMSGFCRMFNLGCGENLVYKFGRRESNAGGRFYEGLIVVFQSTVQSVY